MAKKIELLHTTYDESGNIESQEVVHPLTSPDCIIMENGKTLDEVMGDGIATPTLTHEGTSFKVGVGDSNIEVVDGDVAGMTLKGQSYQNILPKPTTLIMETDEKEFKINDKIDSNIIIDDNIAEIATVKGKTIVNAVQEESGSEYTVLGEDLSGQSIIHVKETPTLEGRTLFNMLDNKYSYCNLPVASEVILDSSVDTYNAERVRVKQIRLTSNLQPGRKYILFANITSLADGKSIGGLTTSIEGVQDYNIPRFAAIGKHCKTFEVEVESNVIALYMDDDATSYVAKMKQLMLFEYQEGMENWDIPYFEGEKYFESNIKGVTLQGQTLVNTIQEPCKDDYVVLGTDGIEISAETGGHGTIENTVQGGINGAVLEGQTLVNINKTVLNNGKINPQYYPTSICDMTMLKTETKYLVIIYNDGDSDAEFYLNQNSFKWNAFTVKTKNTYKTIGTTKTEILDGIWLSCAVQQTTEQNIRVMLIEYQDGMENWDIPYFEGMKSVQMPVVKTTGKNLFNINIFKNESDELEFPYEKWKMQLKPNTTYIANSSITRPNNDETNYDSYGAIINGSEYIEFLYHWSLNIGFVNRIFTTDDTGVIYLGWYKGTCPYNIWDIVEMQIEEGSTATEYEPYQSSTVGMNDYALNITQFEQGTFSESSPAGKPYKETLPTGYMDIRLRSKSLFKISGNTIRGTLNAGYGIFFGFFKDGKYLAKHSSWMDSTNFSVDVPYECTEFCIILRKNISDAINVSEYDLIGLTLEQVYELRGIGDVKDELDLQTGKLTQRIGEVVLDGSDIVYTSNNNYMTEVSTTILTSAFSNRRIDQSIMCKDFPVYLANEAIWQKEYSIVSGVSLVSDIWGFCIRLPHTLTGVTTVDSEDTVKQKFKAYLQSNPITIQYQLETPSVKTVDLTVTDQDGNTIPHIQTQPTVTHITASSDYLIPTVTIDNNLAYDTIIKPSTLYTVRFNHDTVNADNPLTVDLGGTVQTVTSTEFTITTPSELTHNQLVFSGKNNVVSEVQVIEGDVVGTQYPFFEGMNDVQITDMIRNVNLFDINDTVPGYLGGTGTEIKVPDHGNLTSNYIKVKPNTTYVYNHGGFVSNFADYWTGMYFYQDDKGTESNLYTGGTHNRFVHTGQGKKYSNFKFTTPADCEYIRIGSRGLSYDGAWATLYQLDNFSDSKFIARGKNLIHVSKGYGTTSDYNGLTVTRNGADQTITINGTCTSNNTSCELAPFYREFKKGERYAFSCKLISGTADKIIFRINDEQWKGNISCGLKATSSNIYETCIKTFNSDETYNRSSIRVDNGATFNNAVFKVMLEKIPVLGDYTPQYEPFKGVVEVQQDVDSIPLTSDMFEQHGWIHQDMIKGMTMQQFPTFSDTPRIRSKSMIKVKPDTTYTLNTENKFGKSDGGWVVEFDKNGLWNGSRIDDIQTFTTRHDTQYIGFVFLYTDLSAITPSDLDSLNLILQEVPQEIVLRGIGDVKDELDLTRGEYIQRIKEFVLNGSENWAKSQLASGKYAFTTPHNNTVMSSSYCLCADYITYINNGANIPSYFYIGESYFNFLTDGDITLQTFKERLNKKPLKIQCILPNPIIHKVNLTNTKVIPSYTTETHYETITPSDSLIPNITIPSTLNYNVAIKPSTKYTIRANTSDNLTVDLGGATGTLSNGKVTLTTPATLTHNEVKFSGTGKVKELMVVEGNEIKDNVPFFNGMKNVEMGGIKLVNIARVKSVWNNVTTNANKTQYTFTTDVNHAAWGEIGLDDTLLKPNTIYTVMCNVTNNTITNTSMGNCMKWQFKQSIHSFVTIPEKFVGKFVTTLTSPSEYDGNFSLYFVNNASQTGTITIENPMIIEGDWTHLDEIPYIESEMIIEQPIIRSQGKNLFDLETKYFNPSNVTYTKSGTTYTVTGNTSNYNYGQFAWTTEDLWFRKLLGKEVTLSVSSISCTNTNSKACIQVRMECTDGSKVYYTISTNDDAKYETFTIPSNAIDMALQLMSNNTGSPLDSESTLTVSNIQLELGNTATSYEPYKHQTLYSNRVIAYEEGCYYASSTGNRKENSSYTSVLADVDGLEVVYVTSGSSNYSFFDKDGVFISGRSYPNTATADNQNGFIIVPSNAKYMRFACGNANDAYSPYTKATVTGELPLRSLPNGVCDTLNLVTGEYVQRVGEVVLDGSEDWSFEYNGLRAYTEVSDLIRTDDYRGRIICDGDYIITSDHGGVTYYNHPILSGYYDGNNSYPYSNWIYVGIPSITSSEELKQHFTENPLTIQYELATPIVRKLGFTTKGNYREQVLDGSENWGRHGNYGTVTRFNVTIPNMIASEHCHVFSDAFPKGAIGTNDLECINNHGLANQFQLQIKTSRLASDSVESLKQWLSLNPFKMGCLTNNSASLYSNIHKPIFFNNVNVQFLPYNLDIQPQLTYQARTRNSYVLDMAKSNTLYTVKAFSNPHDFYIDGKSFGKGTNGCITTPTLTNKLLVTGSSDVKELMIIEGDVTGKNLPYFKGILSSYHDVDEIELYSVNKNLFDINEVFAQKTLTKPIIENIGVNEYKITKTPVDFALDSGYDNGQVFSVNMKKGETISFSGYSKGIVNARIYKDYNYFENGIASYQFKDLENYEYFNIQRTAAQDCVFCCRFWMNSNDAYVKNIQVEKLSSVTPYIPHAHNTTLIEMPTRLETVKVVRPVMEIGGIDENGQNSSTYLNGVRTRDLIPVKPNMLVSISNNGVNQMANWWLYDIDKNCIGKIQHDNSFDSSTLTIPENTYFVRIHRTQSNIDNLILTLKAYKPIQLNSLPNGVYDEIIMKPNSNKAQLVQRVGKVVLDGSEDWLEGGWNFNDIIEMEMVLSDSVGFNNNMMCESIKVDTFYNLWQQGNQDAKRKESITIFGTNKRLIVALNSNKFGSNNINDKKAYLRQNPLTVYYELATPIIHEIQLKGYPHVYENGTVTLNTDIPHQTFVSYNVNQEQLISTQNETIIRHDQQIDDLYYYIEMYLEEIYQMELFRMKLELSL